MRYLPKEVQ